MAATQAELARQPHYVYMGRDADMKPLYVGCTNNLPRRMAQHEERLYWFPHCAYVEWDTYPDRASGRAAEKALIVGLRPKFNRLGKPAGGAA